MTKGVHLIRPGVGLALALVLLTLVGCGAPTATPTPLPVAATSAPPPAATLPPTDAPTRPAVTPTLVPLVTRTRVPTLTPAPTRVPESARCTTYQPPGTEGPIWDIEVAPDGTVWVAAFRGVARFHPARKEWVAVSVGEEPAVDQFHAITAGADGSVWLATRLGEGVYRWDGTSWSQLTSDDGLLSDWVNDVSLGSDGALWFATQEGASHWDEASGTWNHYSGAGWLYDDAVKQVLFTSDGTVWFAHNEAMTRWRPSDPDDEGGLWEIFGLDNPLATRKAIVSADGRLWLGQLFYDPDTEEWADTVYREIHLQSLAVDGEGGLWIARSDGAIYIPEPESSPPEAWLHLGRAEGLAGDNVTVIALERDDVVWFGTEEGVTRCFIEGLRSPAPTPPPAGDSGPDIIPSTEG
jgi:ligand-binding sensor domain-containing protein